MTDPLYLERLKQLSTRLVSLQKPIRILDAIKWPQGIEQRFREQQGKELPALGADFYQQQKLGFEPDTVSQLLKELKNDVDVVMKAISKDPLSLYYYCNLKNLNLKIA